MKPDTNFDQSDYAMPYHVSKARFEELVEQSLAEVPAPFSKALEEMSIEVRDRPTPAQLRLLGGKSNYLLLGLYHGRPRTQRSVEEPYRYPDVIYIFQEPIELACNSEQELTDQVRKTVLHEIGHHFGMSETDLEDLGYG